MIPFEAAAALHRSAAVPPSAAGRGPRRESSISVTARIVWLFEELTSAGLIRRSEWGLSVVVGTTFDDAHDYAADTALVAAVGCAAMRAMELEPDAKILAEALGRRDDGKRAGFGHPADLACALNAEAHALTGWSTTMPLEGETISLPEGVQLLGVDCGPIPPEAEVKRERARVAARMGIVLMNRILRHKEGLAHDGEAPGLRIATSDYVEHVRDRLPIQLKGAEFLERLGPLSDPGTPVEPELIYKVRSRTEHHVYELARAEQFVDLLRSARCPGDETLLRRAGDLMYASHWSHGQRCGLGSMETDLLVGAIRRSGESGGIFGAKITGGGCGGVVAVLLRDAPEAREALSHVLESFEQQTGRKPRVLRGSIPGVLKLGVQVL
jgi:L-arabinokinase